ncbi:MAG TPA: TIGR01777 family oxidoreductase, partial [Fibrobacteraceae bacterium]|nr:TIGR01777 family oxidoreductase [Fibrobacteraceae bacterium]
HLHVVMRRPFGAIPEGESWIPFHADWLSRLESVDGILNLSGEPIARLWHSPSQRQSLRTSRVGLCRQILTRIAHGEHRPKFWINASATGYYGDAKDSPLTEGCLSGKGFLASLCQEWEQPVMESATIGVREIRLRFGVVLGHQGFLKTILPWFRRGLGGRLGTGQQYFPWIHLDDLAHAVLFLMGKQHFQGACNLVAPNPITQADFAQELAQILGKKQHGNLPSWFLSLLPQIPREMLCSSQRVEADCLRQQGFSFAYPGLKEALLDVIPH